ncbi:MAG: hypothetical protein ACI9KN_000494 [Gammaproteobacteria bacterium]|jgi:uncharacterized protein YceK
MTRNIIGLAIIILLSGCASIISSTTSRFANNLTLAILNQNDLETVRAGAPAYLIMVDGFIEDDPESTSLLLSGSKLYSSYNSAFVDDELRSKKMAERSLAYAKTALCIELPQICNALPLRLDAFTDSLETADKDDLPVLHGFASAWAGSIQSNPEDWNAIANIPKLKSSFERSIELDENFDSGSGHIYLGVLATQIPPALGGKPEIGRVHFEKAIEISNGHNLMIKVLMAQHYARLVFDRTLHDKLLESVLSEPADFAGFTLINTLAKQQARVLLDESDDFF